MLIPLLKSVAERYWQYRFKRGCFVSGIDTEHIGHCQMFQVGCTGVVAVSLENPTNHIMVLLMHEYDIVLNNG